MLEFGGEETFEIVFDDEDAEKIGIAACAEDVPGEGRHAKRGDGCGMKQAEGVAPASCEKRPEENGASAKNNCCGAFGQDGKTKEKAEENQREPRSPRDDRSFV